MDTVIPYFEKKDCTGACRKLVMKSTSIWIRLEIPIRKSMCQVLLYIGLWMLDLGQALFVLQNPLLTLFSFRFFDVVFYVKYFFYIGINGGLFWANIFISLLVIIVKTSIILCKGLISATDLLNSFLIFLSSKWSWTVLKHVIFMFFTRRNLASTYTDFLFFRSHFIFEFWFYKLFCCQQCL